MKQPVIYKIRNVTNDKFYVGSTTDTRERFRTHRSRLRNNRHHSPYLQAAWNKHGEDCFKFEVIEIVPEGASLQAAEDVWLAEHVGQRYCYNVSRFSDAPWRGVPKELHPSYGRKLSPEQRKHLVVKLTEYFQNNTSARVGMHHTPETKALIRDKVARVLAEGRGGHFIPTPETRKLMSASAMGNSNAKGAVRTEEQRQRLSDVNLGNQNFLGKTHSDEARAKISAAKKGLPSHRKGQQMPEEFGRNISAGLKEYYAANPHPMQGRVMSEETKAKLSAAKKGRTYSAEHREKIRQARLGTKASDETRAKLSAMRKGKVRSEDHAAAYNKAVVELTSGQVFPSLKAVKEHYGIAPGQLGDALKDDKPFKRGKFAGLHFRYAAS